MHRIALGILLAGAPVLAIADDAPAPLRPGAGKETVEGICAGCHTLNYIRMNAPFLSEAQWKAEVTKMRQIFRAPIEDDEAAEILGYLNAEYGATK
jgi:sulfite dehydrogenase (cytochrome) subunit B